MAQTVELIETGDGVLSFTREGRKLVKVSFEDRITQQAKARHAAKATITENEVELKRCQECGTWLEQNDRGYWVDFAERFLCKPSPTSMHRIAR